MSKDAPISGAGPTRRLFFGIEMPAFVQARLAELQTDLFGARWQWPEDMHLTLRFLGNLSGETQSRISRAMTALDVEPFDLRVQGVGSFSGKVFWAGIESSEWLEILKRLVDQRLAEVGIPGEDRDFIPHVTLARTSGSPQEVRDVFLEKHSALELAPWTVKYLTLFSSHPAESGPMYRVVERFALGAKRT